MPSARAAAYDAADPLKHFAEQFHRPCDAAGRALIYLCGHSLGLQPKLAATYVQEELADWRTLGVLGHHQAGRPWIGYHEALAAPLAALIGAAADEVVAMNSLTVNLHLMMVSFFRPSGARDCILMEHSAFPSDRYAVASQLAFHGLDPARHLIEILPRPEESALRTEDVIAQIEAHGSRLALVLLPGVQYLTGQALDLAPMISAARRAGASIGLDLAHSIGNTPLQVHDWNADFAVWCSYKYLNAGPGAVGGCFVHARHAEEFARPRFAGWWGHDKQARFQFEPQFRAIPGAQGWQVSNPPILSTAPLLASLQLFERAGLGALREKSLALTAFLEAEVRSQLGETFDIITPTAGDARGCQLSLRLKPSAGNGRAVQEALAAAGVVADWRGADTLRLAPVPFYNSFTDVAAAVAAIHAATAA